MVEIREESTDPLPQGGAGPSSSSSSAQGSNSSTSSPRFASMMDYMKANQMDSILFLCRLVTVFFSICYILPFGSMSTTAYTRAFAAAAATNVFRLRQRLTWFAFSREFLAYMILEDSAHYVMYCIIFITSAPVTMALIPIAFYGVWNSAKFFVAMCNATGNGDSKMCRLVNEQVQKHTANLLGIIACAEIFVFPVFVAMIFMGKVSIFFPLIYGRFLSLRYMSRRNPYTRTAFYQLKCSVHQGVNHPSCPQLVRNIAYKGIELIERFAPATS
ncbi:hypothetical protein QR680_012280 [Steinernema hermaphroditum]|uniref:Transmembrane protein 33 n=1 Tax=Steinernema hermaphroditum TaxID=289476 RepID=A0AA39I2V3_9BILA|nr:hypothetical protein QR680_012280 [Steinernema hermaphroditum]